MNFMPNQSNLLPYPTAIILFMQIKYIKENNKNNGRGGGYEMRCQSVW